MIKKIAERIGRIVLAWSMLHILGGSILAEYHVQHPTWHASLSMVLLLETIGEVLRGRITKPFDKE